MSSTKLLRLFCGFLCLAGCARDITEQWPSDAQGIAKNINACMEVGVGHYEKAKSPALSLEKRLEHIEQAEKYVRHTVELKPDGCGRCVFFMGEIYDTKASYLFQQAAGRQELVEKSKELTRRANTQYEAYVQLHYPRHVAVPEVVFARLAENYRFLEEFTRAKYYYVKFLEEVPDLRPELRAQYEQWIREMDEEIDRVEDEKIGLRRGR